MRRTIFVASTLLLMLVACKPSMEKRIKAIANYEGSIDMQTNEINQQVGDSLISLYIAFADDFPKDSMAANYLFKAADVAANVGRPNDAIGFLDRLISAFPNYEKVGDAYFLKGFIYENQIFDNEKAKISYQAFVQKFPNHPFANDTRTLIENIGLTPEQLIEKLTMKDTLSK